MSLLADEQYRAGNPGWAVTLDKIGAAAQGLGWLQKAIGGLDLAINGLDALLSPKHCAHLNLKPLIDSSGNINEDVLRLMEGRYEYVWEESAASAAREMSAHTLATDVGSGVT